MDAVTAAKNIVVVDDEIDLRRLIVRILRMAGYDHVFLASNGLEALDLLEKIRADLVLSDLSMPVMSGYQLIESIRNSERLCSIPVIAVSARNPPKDHQERWNAYLSKPFPIERLLELVKGFVEPENEV